MIIEYVKNISMYMIISTILLNLFPNEQYRKYLRLFSGVLLLLIILKPVGDFLGCSFNMDSIISTPDIIDNTILDEEINQYEEIIRERIENIESETKNE